MHYLIKGFKAVIFEKDELEFRHMSELQGFLTTSGLSGFQFRRRDKTLGHLKTNSPLQVQRHPD